MSEMRNALLAATVIAILNSSVKAQTPENSETDRSMANVVSTCTGKNRLQSSLCIGYVEGVIALTRNAAKEDITLPSYMASCIPDSANFEKIYLKVIAMMSSAIKTDPAGTADIGGAAAIVATLGRLYPCPGR
jgi:hypothetical protein